MLKKLLTGAVRPLASFLQVDHMRRLGIANTMHLAKVLNKVKSRRAIEYRKAAYCDHFAELIAENGTPRAGLPEMRDGWVMDTSRRWPHLDRLLDESEKIIAERAGVKRKQAGAYRSFFQNLLEPGDLERFPSILDFALSSDVLSVVCNYLKCIPAMPVSIPGGVRFAESSIEYDDAPHVLKDSQLFHIDYFCKPSVYVIVLLRDVTIQNGPFCLVPASRSRQAAAALRYWSRGRPYRLSDAEVYSVIDPSEVIALTQPAGTLLFLDPSACLHFGSRNAVKPRYQLMLAYTAGYRTDFNEFLTNRHHYPQRPDDSRLARMVLNVDIGRAELVV